MPEPRELQEFLSWTPEPLRPLIGDGVMYEGSKVVLYGRYKSLKSMVAIWLGLALAKGEKWLGHNTTPCSVMYLQLEMPEPMLQKRIKKMLSTVTEQTQHSLWLWSEFSLKIDDTEGFNRLAYTIDKFKPEVLIIDPIYKVMRGNLLDARQVQDLLDNIDKLIGQFPTMGCLLVSHSRKAATDGGSAQGTDDLLGSVLFSAWADSILKVTRKEWGDIEVSYDIMRNAEEEMPARLYHFDEATCTFTPPVLQLSRNNGDTSNDNSSTTNS